MGLYFTADFHFNHTNIIKYCNRPFSSVKEMNETIIENWNKVIKPQDYVWILGDIGWFKNVKEVDSFLRKLNGNKGLIVGNHDKPFVLKSYHWSDIGHLKDIKYKDQPITLCHYAMRVWDLSHFGSWQLYGHTHAQLPDVGLLQYDVGVDNNNFTPISFEEIKEIMDKIPFIPIDKRDIKTEEEGVKEIFKDWQNNNKMES